MLPNIFMITHIYPVIELIRTTFVQLPPPIKIMNKMNHKMSFLVFDIQRISNRWIICARIPVFRRNLTFVTYSAFLNLMKTCSNKSYFHIINSMSTISYYQNRTMKISLRFLLEIALAVLFVIAIIAH